MLFYDQNNQVCAHIRIRGLVCVDTASPYFDEGSPYTSFTICDEAAPCTNPYGDVLLVHDHLPRGLCYNTVLQELVPEDWSNMFSVEDGERNPYTEMLHGLVSVSLDSGTSFFLGDLTYDSKTKTIHCEPDGDVDAPFDMKKDEFIKTYEVRCLDI